MHRSLRNGQPPIRRHHDPRALIRELLEHNRPDEFGRRRSRVPVDPQPAVEQPGLLARIVARLRGRSRKRSRNAADKDVSAAGFPRLGSRDATHYIRLLDATGEDTQSGPARRDLAA
jgi:hypothetical protein